jgi:hypothetical protein
MRFHLWRLGVELNTSERRLCMRTIPQRGQLRVRNKGACSDATTTTPAGEPNGPEANLATSDTTLTPLSAQHAETVGNPEQRDGLR